MLVNTEVDDRNFEGDLWPYIFIDDGIDFRNADILLCS